MYNFKGSFRWCYKMLGWIDLQDHSALFSLVLLAHPHIVIISLINNPGRRDAEDGRQHSPHWSCWFVRSLFHFLSWEFFRGAGCSSSWHCAANNKWAGLQKKIIFSVTRLHRFQRCVRTHQPEWKHFVLQNRGTAETLLLFVLNMLPPDHGDFKSG